MPKVHNPWPHDLFSNVLNRTVRRDQTVEVTQEQLDQFPRTGIWDLIEDEPAKRTPRNNTGRRTGGKVTEVNGKQGERR